MRKREVVSHLLMFQDKPPEDGGPPDIVVCAEPVPTSKIDYGTRITAVRSFVRILARFSLVGTNRSKVNIVMNFDARGNIPASIMTLLVPRSLFSLNQMRTLFQRDDEVDAHTEGEWVGGGWGGGGLGGGGSTGEGGRSGGRASEASARARSKSTRSTRSTRKKAQEERASESRAQEEEALVASRVERKRRRSSLGQSTRGGGPSSC